MALIEINLAGLSSKGSKQKLFRFVDGAGQRINAAETFTLSCNDDERIIISALYASSTSSGTSDFTLDAGSRRIYNQGDRVISNTSPNPLNQQLVILSSHKDTNANIFLGLGEDLGLANLSSGAIYLYWQIEQTDEA